ncbi:hypothetical protein [Methylobacterium brachythecii]|uniref:Uncharacterized protein n=1 Tax=Methylobacterium brachythecii TaxID=1176177 RepID=A0A7W6AIV7_9HYPH|nr:hypothetical protein [Methylobacterium brachythecii]MBB3904167.1 hypothetical protein [Methylobacterium brachythecii]GLS45171.1 hypothetical protein GCM10007884_31600 [Methylobacterium brachythecii]
MSLDDTSVADALAGELPALEHLQLRLEDGIVTGRFRSNVEQPDCLSVEPEIYEAVADRMGRCKYEGGELSDYEPPPPPPPPLPAITDRQFGEGLWREKLISFDEYLAFVGPGTVPPPLLAIINTLPDDDTGNPTPRKVALGLVTGAQTYAFDNSLVDVVRQAQGWTEDYLRERWAEWAQL